MYFFGQAQSALSISLLQRGSLELVQAFTLMANYLQKRNKPNSGFTFLGIALNMALGLGMHHEFSDTAISILTMEIRRRVWWTLFVFDSGARLTFGRSSMALHGGNVRHPRNLDDTGLTIDDDSLKDPQPYPTVTSSLIWQCKLAAISNEANARFLERPFPDISDMSALDDQVVAWWHSLPSYFKESLEPSLSWFEIPRMVLLWRAQHLRIVITRPFLLELLQSRRPLALTDESTLVGRCISASRECTRSIVDFCASRQNFPGSLTWYATYWLVTSVFVSVTCMVYDPYHDSALEWRSEIEQARATLQTLAVVEVIADRAVYILSRILGKCSISLLFHGLKLNHFLQSLCLPVQT